VRIADWYAEQGIGFDPEQGFDPGHVLREHRAWSDRWGMLPAGWSALADRVTASDATARARALETHGLGYALAGARLRAAAPGPAPPGAARVLLAIDPDDERAKRFSRAVAAVSRATSPEARIAVINVLPLLTSRQPLRQ
jgi:hypothetical protein